MTVEDRPRGMFQCPYGCHRQVMLITGLPLKQDEKMPRLGERYWDALGQTVERRRTTDPNVYVLLATCGEHHFEMVLSGVEYRIAEPPGDVNAD